VQSIFPEAFNAETTARMKEAFDKVDWSSIEPADTELLARMAAEKVLSMNEDAEVRAAFLDEASRMYFEQSGRGAAILVDAAGALSGAGVRQLRSGLEFAGDTINVLLDDLFDFSRKSAEQFSTSFSQEFNQ